MSIYDEIWEARCQRRLIVHQTLIKGNQPRVVLIETGFYEELTTEARGDGQNSYRLAQLIRDFDRFSLGRLITVGYGKENSCFMKFLDPESDDVWEIRSRDPKPSWRVLCRFAAPNLLIAFNAAPRNFLEEEGSRQWRELIRDCKRRWRTVFPTYQPFHGSVARDYITDNVVVVGNLP